MSEKDQAFTPQRVMDKLYELQEKHPKVGDYEHDARYAYPSRMRDFKKWLESLGAERPKL